VGDMANGERVGAKVGKFVGVIDDELRWVMKSLFIIIEEKKEFVKSMSRQNSIIVKDT
jgi:hypothetical protein